MISGTNSNALAALLHARQHAFTSGVTQKLGGGDEGPDPHELLEAALAACTVITVEMYAKRKAMPLDAIKVNVKIESEGEETRISRQVGLVGNLSEGERTRLLEIANKCPIHRLLSHPVKVNTSLVTAEG